MSKSNLWGKLSLGRFTYDQGLIAGVAKLVDALDLGSSALRRGGSSPFSRTTSMSNAVNPIFKSQDWLKRAVQTGMRNPNAACLCTLSPQGDPDGRIVLVKKITEKGFAFYTNAHSQKGRSLAHCPKATLVFYWDDLGRQLRVTGAIEGASEAESDAYFAERPRDSQIGAWASLQSETMPTPEALSERIAVFDTQFLGQEVPRPPHWKGYWVLPEKIEFWTEKPFRLHEREVYRREDMAWQIERVYP